MHSFLGVAISLALLGLVSSQATNVTHSLDAYIEQNQRQWDAKIRLYEDEMDNFRLLFSKRLEAIDSQADSMELKLNEASARLDPLALISPWTRNCVQNYSSTIPTVNIARAAIVKCKESISNVLTSVESTSNTLKSYYNVNVKNGLADCVKRFPNAQLNYTICVTKVVGDANKYTVTNQNTFNTNLKNAECTADSRIRSSWQCSFNQVYSYTSTVEVALRLVDDCIANREVCGSEACISGCPNVTNINLADISFSNDTIPNPFRLISKQSECLTFKFK
ncbi:hypothetical protein KR009_006325 [Drosophila setifemur]|nr:hypothetical protein KR009_006325 [Drosophila setifemur]